MTDTRSKIQNSDTVVFAFSPTSLRGMRLSSGKPLDTALVELSALAYTITGDEPTALKNKDGGPVMVDSKRLRELENASEMLEAFEAHGVDNWEWYSEAVACGRGEPCELCATDEDGDE